MRCISIDSANGLMGVTGCKRCLMNVLSHTIRVLGIRTNSHCLPAASDASCAAAAAGPPHPMASCSDAAAALVLGCQLQQPCRAAVDPGKQSVRHCVRPSVRTAVHNSAPKQTRGRQSSSVPCVRACDAFYWSLTATLTTITPAPVDISFPLAHRQVCIALFPVLLRGFHQLSLR